MKLRILGCSGGIGGHLRTTSMLLDRDVLIDAGTGVGDLNLDALAGIDHVFLTHSHLDHVTSIPFLVDSVGYMRGRPLTVHALPETLQILRDHVFNWKVWPDFTEIPSAEAPYLRYEELALGNTVAMDGRRITPIPANHVVPAVGFQLDSGMASLVFSGDTTTNDALWEVVNRIPNLRYLIIETAFSNKEMRLAIASKHLCPSMLAQELAKLRCRPEVFITHLKPGEIELTMKEIEECVAEFRPRMLFNDQVFDF
ncbi:MAG: 3',5'-cyclic-nucleotide phosphodiesterase [Betaproteobacteria bacterium]|nr:3',5'-cyclic-nucleotide phosphodiesterase [Betaproteobacteria bacterium]